MAKKWDRLMKMLAGANPQHFVNSAIKLWELPGDMFKQPGMEGLLPLLPLTKDGARREVVEEMIVAMQAANKEDLLPIAYVFATLVFTRREDKKWLKWRFDMLEDIIEESGYIRKYWRKDL